MGILLSVHHEWFGSSLVIEEIARDSPLDCSLMSADRPSGRQHTCNEPELMDRLLRSSVTIGDHRKFHASAEHLLGLVERDCQSPSLVLLGEAAAVHVHHHWMNNPSKRNVVHKDRWCMSRDDSTVTHVDIRPCNNELISPRRDVELDDEFVS